MKSHHEAWLKAHPERTEEWLSQAIDQGFDVHHLDENHKNNHPENLVLIEHTDHLRLHHNWDTRNSVFEGFRLEKAGEWDKSWGERIYTSKKENPGKTWKEIGQEIGYLEYLKNKGSLREKGVVMKSIATAKRWALYHEKEWPIPSS